jgi:hypothetical protein
MCCERRVRPRGRSPRGTGLGDGTDAAGSSAPRASLSPMRTASVTTSLACALALAACASPGFGPGSTRPGGPAATIAVDGASPREVPLRYGQNYWCWNGYGNHVAPIQPLVKSLGLQLLRAGGYNNDAEKSTGVYGSDPFGHAQIDAFVAYAREVGAEPVLQVPLIDNYKRHGGTADPADAAAMVTYVNVTRGYGVKYWEIGNEPDLYPDLNNGVRDLPGYTVQRFIADYKAFAAAMKAADPTIQLLGPELAWKYHPNQPKGSANDWLTPFLRECKGVYDVIAIHRYPFRADQCTVDAAMNDVGRYEDFVRKAQALIAEEAPGTPFAITEANITWDGDPKHSTYPASTPTIYAGLWLADNLAASRELGLWGQAYWSLSEGWTLGFVDAETRQPRPEYHAFRLVREHLGRTALAAAAPAGFSAYAARSPGDDATVVMALNKHGTDDPVTFTFSNVSGAPAAGFTATLPAYSITVLTFPDGGGAPGVLRYAGTEVDAGQGPRPAP